MRGHTLKEVQQMFKNNNLIFNELEYIPSKEKHKYICIKCKYHGEKSLGGIKQNQGCPQCASNRKYIFNEAKKIFKEHGYTLLEDIYINVRTLMKYKCDKCNDIRKKSLGSVIDGRGCAKCIGISKRYTQEEANNFFKKQNLTLLETYTQLQKAIKCKCDICGYERKTNLGNVIKGTKCPKCSKKLKYTIEQCREKFKNLNMTLMNIEYFGKEKTMNYICDICKYEGKKSLGSINAGQDCPKCALEKTRYTNNELKNMFEKHNIIFLERNINNKKLKAKCKQCNYEWETDTTGIKRGNGCPKCFIKKNERYVIKTVEEILNTTFIINDNKLLGNKLQCDGVNHELKLIIEVNGIQHYVWPSIYFDTKEKFIQQQKRDKIKKIRAKKLGYNFIVVPYWIEYKNIKNFLIRELKNIGFEAYMVNI